MIFLLGLAIVYQWLPAQVPAYKNKALKTEQRIQDLLKRMTLDEKIGQLNQLSGGVLTGPAAANDQGQQGKLKDLREGKIGSFLNVLGAAETRSVQKIAVEETRLGIPLVFGFDIIHGYRTVFPIPLAESGTFDPDLAEKAAAIAAREGAAAGVHWTFAPMCDVSRDPRWGRVMEGVGEDPYLGSMMSAARVKGFQRKLGDIASVAACVKHFAGYGASEAGRDYNAVDMSRYQLWNYYMPPYEAAVKAGAATVMNSFNYFDGIPASGNNFLVNDVLRKRWGFKGLVVSDWASFQEMITHGVAANGAEAVRMALNAGSDMDMEGRVAVANLAAEVKAGRVSPARLDQAVASVLKLKFDLGLFDDPYKFCDESREKAELMKPEHLQAAREAAARSMLLLKNEGNALPLKKNLQKVLVVGRYADDPDHCLDFWIGQGNKNEVVGYRKGIENKLGRSVDFAHGYNGDGMTTEALLAEAKSKAINAEVIIAVVGLSGQVAGEARSLAYPELSAGQKELLRTLKATGKNVIVVLHTGRPLVITDIEKDFSAILCAWIGGTEQGNGLADVLFGDYNPSAKTPMSWPWAIGQIPVYYNHTNTGRPFNNPNDFWVSRYRDIPNTPLYPFGYGLSYTNFTMSGPQTAKANYGRSEKITVNVQVNNTGSVAGEEVVQLYIRDLVASRVRPVKELKAFKKVMLQPGQSTTVSFELTQKDFSFYDENGKLLFEPGDFYLYTGGNSRDTQSYLINIK